MGASSRATTWFARGCSPLYDCDRNNKSAVSDVQLSFPIRVSEPASAPVVGSTGSVLVRLTGIEPAHTASEADALSPELQAHINKNTYNNIIIAKTLEICKHL